MSLVYKYHYEITASRANPNATMAKPDENYPASKELQQAPSAELQAHCTAKQLYKIYTSILSHFLEHHCGENNIVSIERAAGKRVYGGVQINYLSIKLSLRT